MTSNATADATNDVAPTSGFHGRLFGFVAPIYAKLWKPIVLGTLSGGGFERELQDILDLHRPRGDELMIDLGCGPGNFTTAFAKLAPKGFIAGLDLAYPMLQVARGNAGRAGATNTAFTQANAQRLPIRRDSIAMVSFCGTLHLLPQPELALAEVAAILRPGGSLVGMTFVKGEWWGQRLIERFFNRFLHFRFFPHDQVQKMFADAGLKMEGCTRKRLIVLFHAKKPG